MERREGNRTGKPVNYNVERLSSEGRFFYVVIYVVIKLLW